MSGTKKKSEIVGISFKDYYKEEYEFLEKQDNKSRFVCELIRSYMKDNAEKKEQ